MHEKTQQSGALATSVGAFGAALSAMTLAPEVDAAVVELTPTPGSVPYLATTLNAQFIDLGIGDPDVDDFVQFNDIYGKSFGAGSGSLDVVGFMPAGFGSTITADVDFSSFVPMTPDAIGTATFGFLTGADQVGWIRIQFGGSGGAVTYLAAAFNDTPRGNIVAGTTGTVTIAEPATTGLLAGIGLLAMGAGGIRRMRRDRQVADRQTHRP